MEFLYRTKNFFTFIAVVCGYFEYKYQCEQLIPDTFPLLQRLALIIYPVIVGALLLLLYKNEPLCYSPIKYVTVDPYNNTDYEEPIKFIRDICTRLNAVGFACECPSNYIHHGENHVSIIQMAIWDGRTFLFRFPYKSMALPTGLRQILEDQNILKIGVGCYEDAKYISRDYNIQVRGCLDLRHIYETHECLSTLINTILGKDTLIRKWNYYDSRGTNIFEVERYIAQCAWGALEVYKKWLLFTWDSNNRKNLKFVDVQHFIDKISADSEVCNKIPQGMLNRMFNTENAKSDISDCGKQVPRKIYVTASRLKKEFLIKYYLIDSNYEVQACKIINEFCNKYSAIGFDCEWRPNYICHEEPHHVSLIQITVWDGQTFIIRIQDKYNGVPRCLREILEDEKILKLGINCCEDAKNILRDYGIQVRGCLDLRHLYGKQISLANLSEEVLGVTLSKKFAMTNWEKPVLTEDEQRYAAIDSWVGLEIYKTWKNSNPNSDIKDFVDVSFSIKTQRKDQENIQDLNNIKSATPTCIRTKSLYDNIRMYTPEGVLLNTCSERKAEWYVKNNLASTTKQNSITLNFEPRSKPSNVAQDCVSRKVKENMCVVCGSVKCLMRYYVVPREYRIYFPKQKKNHRSHDIVLTCSNCHGLAKTKFTELRNKLAVICDAPINGTEPESVTTFKNIKRMCTALLYSGDKIPFQRKKYLEEEIKKHFKLHRLDRDTLFHLSKCKNHPDERGLMKHGEKVVRHYQENLTIEALEKKCRQLFLKTLHPKFLPSNW